MEALVTRRWSTADGGAPRWYKGQYILARMLAAFHENHSTAQPHFFDSMESASSYTGPGRIRRSSADGGAQGGCTDGIIYL